MTSIVTPAEGGKDARARGGRGPAYYLLAARQGGELRALGRWGPGWAGHSWRRRGGPGHVRVSV